MVGALLFCRQHLVNLHSVVLLPPVPNKSVEHFAGVHLSAMYQGLEVHDHNLPEVDRRHESHLYTVDTEHHPQKPPKIAGHSVQAAPDENGRQIVPSAEKSKRICGVGRGRFLLAAAIISLTLVVAAVGGGVGATIASKNSASAT